ncbi:hypothetical protein ATN83_1808 [Raoultella ornithinolytica]|nr:hypothetical protein ATN83_1808 [Raoultella ornithinolytica]
MFADMAGKVSTPREALSPDLLNSCRIRIRKDVRKQKARLSFLKRAF